MLPLLRRLIWQLLKLLFGIKVFGADRLKFAGPALLLPNHVSFLDPVILYACLPGETCFVVNTDIAAKFRFVLRWVNHVTLDPLNPYSLKKIVAAVKAGRLVVLFPEGRITTTGGLMKIYSGAGFVALKTGVPVYPVVFLGPELSKFSRIKDKVRSRWFPRISVHIGQAVCFGSSSRTGYIRQKKEISDRILTLLQEALFSARQQRESCDSLFDKLRETARTHGSGRIAAEDISGSVTYRRLIVGSYVLGQKLRPLLLAEGRIGVMLPSSIGHAVLLFALFYLGKTPAILNFSTGAESCLACCELAALKTVITSRAFIERGQLRELAARLAGKLRLIFLEDLKQEIGLGGQFAGLLSYLAGEKAAKPPGHGKPEIILFTSGSEGQPKGVVLTHSNILANINQVASVIDYTPRDKMLNALPMFHAFGLTAGTLLPLLHGLEVYLYPSPLHYKIIPEIAYDRNITILLGTPTFLYGYARYAHHYDFYSMRLVLAGGEKLKDEVRQIWQEKFGIRVYEGYGATEAGPVLSLNTPLFNRIGTAGRFLPGIEWRVEKVPGIETGGNLLVKGPNIMAGYLLPGKGFAPAPEWHDLGDVVSVDKGFVTIQARLKRFAKVSGEIVSLDAVEKAAQMCFGTDLNAAISIPDTRKGEKIILYTAAGGATRQALREYMARTGQSMLAMPAKLVVVKSLPQLGSGKTDYAALRAMALAEEKGRD